MKTSKILLLLLPAIIFSQITLAIEPPNGWRLPTDKELSGEPLREKSPTKNAKVIHDLNSDGKADHAFLFKSTEFSGEGLLVYLSSPGGYSWEVLSEIDWGKKYPIVDLVMGIDAAEPGEYETACGKGYWECEKNEPETLILKAPGIWHFKFESAASIWYWNEDSNEFIPVSISD